MKYAEKVKNKFCKEIDEIGERLGSGGGMKASEIDALQKMTDTVKNILKIEMLEEESGYSQRGGSYGSYRESYRGGSSRNSRGGSYGSYNDGSMRGGSYGDESYDDGESYARRGQHYVRGHYSYADDDMSMARGRGRSRGYSRAEAKDEMMEKMGEMMTEANEEEREILKKAMRQLEQV